MTGPVLTMRRERGGRLVLMEPCACRECHVMRSLHVFIDGTLRCWVCQDEQEQARAAAAPTRRLGCAPRSIGGLIAPVLRRAASLV